MPDIQSRLPVTIITGFLGSGKTTLLNHILQNNRGSKIAVLVNEFGEINLDSQLLVSYDNDLVELSNGCICCTINQGLVEAVRRILARSEVERAIVETTGVADPLPIISTFVGSDFRDFTRLDSVVTVVDAETFTPEHFDSDAAFKQINYADIILLNKIDLVDRPRLEALESYLASTKNNPRILPTKYGQIPLPLILDVDSIIADRQPEANRNSHSHHLTTDDFVSMSFQSDRPLDVYKFHRFLNQQLPAEVFRAKGIIWYGGSKLRHVFQLCGRRYDLKSDNWSTSPSNQLVFIGRNLDTEKLHQQLSECLLTSTTPFAN